MEQKFKHAAAFKEHYSVARPIYLDALDGPCHLTYGGFPNMTWIFDHRGIPVYKCDWTDHHSVKNALQYFLEVKQRQGAGEVVVPFRAERLDYRESNREKFDKGLLVAGQKAFDEFREMFPRES